MKIIPYLIISILFCLALNLSCAPRGDSYCLTGAFLADSPAEKDILGFKEAYGKKPYFILVFIDWGNFLDEEVIMATYSQNCALLVTWEPWEARTKQGVSFDDILAGSYDRYISDFAGRLGRIKKPVYLRFAHEMNGDWYPWAGIKTGKVKFIKTYRYLRELCAKNKVDNIKWVFSVNHEDVPRQDNHFLDYYPGDSYVDYVGIDGYNWGNSAPWGRWLKFKNIFMSRYKDIEASIKKPVLITEFGSTSSGGSKVAWIKDAFNSIKGMDKIKGFVLFNIDKETDWSFAAHTDAAVELKGQLKDAYFRENID